MRKIRTQGRIPIRKADVPPGWDRWVGYQSGYFGYRVSFDGIHRMFGFASEDYSTDVFTHEAVDFVATAGDKPLFLVYAPFAPHGPVFRIR